MAAMLSVSSPAIAEKPRDPHRFAPEEFSIECQLQPEGTLYEGQPVRCVYVLHSPTPDVSAARILAAPELRNGTPSILSRIQPDDPGYVEETKNGPEYCFPIASYILTLPAEGKNAVKKNAFEIDVAYPKMVRDPFWGYVRTLDSETFILKADEIPLKVKSLPQAPANSSFSGAIGNFKINAILPPGDIIVNEDAVVVVKISGEGIIPDDTMPEYRKAFNENAKLKSVSESRNSYVRDGRLYSELNLECTFIPSARSEVEIGSIQFDFFNPATGSYSTVTSRPIPVSVESSTLHRPTIEI